MKVRTRFIKSVIATAKAQEHADLPWTRGKARRARAVRRNTPAFDTRTPLARSAGRIRPGR